MLLLVCLEVLLDHLDVVDFDCLPQLGMLVLALRMKSIGFVIHIHVSRDLQHVFEFGWSYLKSEWVVMTYCLGFSFDPGAI